MKKLKWMALIAVGWGLLGCEKTAAIIEEPKVENCIEATYLGVGCGSAFFSITDTTKVKGTFKDSSWYSGTVFGYDDMIVKKLPKPYRVFVGLFWESKIADIKLKVDRKYHFEFRKTKPGEKNSIFADRGRCFPHAVFYDQIVLLDTLTSKCLIK